MTEPKVIKTKSGETYYPYVGAVILKNNWILMIDRKIPPYGWISVTGHIDKSETPLKALIRIVKEKSGLEMICCTILFEGDLNNICGREDECNYWYVYRCDVKGEIKMEKEEVKEMRWINIDKLCELELEPVWMYILKKIKLL